MKRTKVIALSLALIALTSTLVGCNKNEVDTDASAPKEIVEERKESEAELQAIHNTLLEVQTMKKK